MSEIKTLYSGKYINLVEKDGWEFVTRNHHDVAIIMPVFDNGDILLIDEFRHPLQKRVIGLPAGLVGDDGPEDMIDGARRELLEETGYLSKTMKCVLKDSPSSSGLTNETFDMFLATGLTKVGPGGGVDSEDINVLIISPNDFLKRVPEWQSEGYAIDPKVFVGLYFINNG